MSRGITHIGWVDWLEVVFDAGTCRLDFRLTLEAVIELVLVTDELPDRVVEVFGECTGMVERPDTCWMCATRHAGGNVVEVDYRVGVTAGGTTE
jgi:hypothetical protein